MTVSSKTDEDVSTVSPGLVDHQDLGSVEEKKDLGLYEEEKEPFKTMSLVEEEEEKEESTDLMESSVVKS